MIPAGKYRARATTATFGETKKGDPQVAVEFRIEDDGHEGETLTWYGYFSEKTTTRTIESLRLCGCTFPNDDITNLAGVGSAVVELDIGHDTYEGKTRARINWVNALNSGPRVKAMEDASKMSFAQRMKGAVVSIKATTPAPTNAPPITPPAAATGTDDDIPF